MKRSHSTEGRWERPGTATSWLRPWTSPAPEASRCCQRDPPAPAWAAGVMGQAPGEHQQPPLHMPIPQIQIPQTT